MYISRINTIEKEVADVYALHQWIWQGFGGKDMDQKRNFLFRVETFARKRAVILIQSLEKPRWEGVFPIEDVEMKSYEPAFEKDRSYQFMIHASASFTKPRGPNKKSIRLPLKPGQYENWFAKQGESKGFKPLAVVRAHDISVKSRKKKKMNISGQIMSGVLRVEDPEIFLPAYRDGIGRARGFGFGMLSLIKV
ncbi:type I-E CRISPR-associated protein Cas6/Cse3/CasE [Desulfobacterales bacterium HSG16]|nr:type I-E CRISPR-associated protein Cas6/Cse3/CasE [Desulfobacterales bacterium HSG16]